MGAEPRMKLHGIILVTYNPTKTATIKTTLRDVDLDISAAGLLITMPNGIQHFFPAHMVVRAKLADRGAFKAFDKDPDIDPTA